MTWIIACFILVAISVIIMAYNRELPPEDETNGGCAVMCVLIICLAVSILAIYAMIKSYPML